MKNKKYFYFLLITFFYFGSFSASKTRSFLKDNFECDFKLNYLASVQSQNYFDQEFNYTNAILKKSDTEFKQELQPDLKLGLKMFPLKWRLKPKLKYKYGHYIIESKNQYFNISEYGFWENYLSLELTSNFEFSVGIINIQWGSSELLNPSQTLVSQQILNLAPFQYTQGIEMLNAQWTPSQNLTLNILKELYPFDWDHSDELVTIKRKFSEKLLIRGEYASSSGALVLGQVLATKKTDKDRFNYGAYGLLNYTDWTQIYFDFLIQKGSEVIYLDENMKLSPVYEDSDYLFSLGLIGHRLTFENGIEWKVEYIFNSFGKTTSERDFEANALKKNPLDSIALTAYYQRSYILPGQSYIYNSLRWDEPKWLSSLFSSSTMYLRVLSSLADSSGFTQFEFQSSLSDSWTQGMAFAKSFGEEKKDLNSELDYLAVYSIKKTF